MLALFIVEELQLALVLSTKAHANIVAIDPSEAIKMPGVELFLCHKDVPGSNSTGLAMQDEEVFATTKVCNAMI